MNKSTPTLWNVHENFTHHEKLEVYADNKKVAFFQNEADAALAVKCVNHFPALVEALREITKTTFAVECIQIAKQALKAVEENP